MSIPFDICQRPENYILPRTDTKSKNIVLSYNIHTVLRPRLFTQKWTGDVPIDDISDSVFRPLTPYSSHFTLGSRHVIL